MSIKLQTIKCPECGAALSIEEGRQQAFCGYCGAKVVVSNENEYIYRHIDEAGIRQAEVRMRELDIQERKAREEAERAKALEEQRRVEEQKYKKRRLISLIAGVAMIVIGISAAAAKSSFGALLLIAGIVVLVVGRKKHKEEEPASDGSLCLPEYMSDLEKKDYRAVEQVLRSTGFTNITCIEKNDLTFGFIKKQGEVESVSVGGKTMWSEEINAWSKKARFDPDVPITIVYHGFARR